MGNAHWAWAISFTYLRIMVFVALLDGGVPIAHSSEKVALFSILESDNGDGGVPIALAEISLLPHKSVPPYFPSFLSALATITTFRIVARKMTVQRTMVRCNVCKFWC